MALLEYDQLLIILPSLKKGRVTKRKVELRRGAATICNTLSQLIAGSQLLLIAGWLSPN